MRVLVVLALLLGAARAVHAQPLRVTIQCENTGRTKACPAFLLGIVDAHKVLLQAPRADADVMVYVNATQVALLDRIHLRFVGRVPGAPPLIELDVDLDSRGDDDSQLAQLRPAFMRGIALFVAARFPKLVTVELGQPDGEEAKPKHVSPYDLSLELGGYASRSGPYENYSSWSSIRVARVQTRKRLSAITWGNAGLNRQPPLTLEDGTKISTNASNWTAGVQAAGAYLYNHCYSVGGSTSTWREDPKGQFRYGWDAKLGVEWDKYRADDARGNRLSIAYILAYTVEGYNLRNVLGERWAHFPKHQLVASGQLRKDKIRLGLQVQIGGELIHPERRHAIGASPSLEWQLGDHVDITFSFSVTKRELPAPDTALIDPLDYAQLSRLSYAEPFQMNGSFNVRIHWDRTNGQRNDRLDML